MKRHLRLSQTLFIVLLTVAALGAAKGEAKNSSEPDDELALQDGNYNAEENVLAQEDEFVLFGGKDPLLAIICHSKIDCKDKKTGVDRKGVLPFGLYGTYVSPTDCAADLAAKKKKWEAEDLEKEVAPVCAPKTAVILSTNCSCEFLRPAE